MLLDIFRFGIMFSIPPQNRSKTVGVWGVCVLLIYFFFLSLLLNPSYLQVFSQAKTGKMREEISPQLSISLEKLGRSRILQHLTKPGETKKSNCQCFRQA